MIVWVNEIDNAQVADAKLQRAKCRGLYRSAARHGRLQAHSEHSVSHSTLAAAARTAVAPGRA